MEHAVGSSRARHDVLAAQQHKYVYRQEHTLQVQGQVAALAAPGHSVWAVILLQDPQASAASEQSVHAHLKHDELLKCYIWGDMNLGRLEPAGIQWSCRQSTHAYLKVAGSCRQWVILHAVGARMPEGLW